MPLSYHVCLDNGRGLCRLLRRCVPRKALTHPGHCERPESAAISSLQLHLRSMRLLRRCSSQRHLVIASDRRVRGNLPPACHCERSKRARQSRHFERLDCFGRYTPSQRHGVKRLLRRYVLAKTAGAAFSMKPSNSGLTRLTMR